MAADVRVDVGPCGVRGNRLDRCARRPGAARQRALPLALGDRSGAPGYSRLLGDVDHVTLRTGDLPASLELYSRVFELLSFAGERFSIAQADEQHPPTRGVHIGFAATSRVAELAAAKRFNTGTAPAVGLQARDLGDRLQLIATSGTFSLLAGVATEHLHFAIGVENEERVRDFHAFGLHAGGRDNGLPGERPEYHAGYYGAYLLDPDSNNVEAVFHDRVAA